MDAVDLERQYTPRDWEVYELEIDSEWRELQKLTETTGLTSCGASSAFALDHFKRTSSIDGLFFYDTEQIFMDLDTVYGELFLGKLTQEWRGHPVGSLVFAVTRITEKSKFTVAVERTS